MTWMTELARPEIGFCIFVNPCGLALFVVVWLAHKISDGSSHHTLSDPALQGDKAILIGWVKVSDPLVHARALTSFLDNRLTEHSFIEFSQD